MKKKGMCLVLLCLTLLLGACHGGGGREELSVPESLDESRQLQITFWAKNDTNVSQTRIYEKAIGDFEALYPNIHVNMRLYTDYGKIYNDVITNIATDTTPNVCISYPDHIATYLSGSRTVLPLGEWMADERYGLGGSELRFEGAGAEGVNGRFLQEGVLNDEQYALPFMRSTEACYINKEMVEALGYTIPEELSWDFVWEVSEAAVALGKDADGNWKLNGQKVLLPFIYKSTDNMMIQLLAQKGAGYSDERGSIEIFNDDTKEILESLAAHTASGAFSTFKISGYPANFLNAGQCIFAIDSTAGATWMGSHAPHVDISEDKLREFTTVVKCIPQLQTGEAKMISQGPSLCIFEKDDAQEVLASWLFTQFLLDDSVQVAYAQTEGYVPVTNSAVHSAEYTDYLARSGEDDDLYYPVKITASKLLLEHTQDCFVTPVFNGSASLRDAAGQMIEEVCKAGRRKQNVDDAYIDKLYNDMNALYRLDQTGRDVNSDLGELPFASKFLLATLFLAWCGIFAYLFLRHRKRKG